MADIEKLAQEAQLTSYPDGLWSGSTTRLLELCERYHAARCRALVAGVEPETVAWMRADGLKAMPHVDREACQEAGDKFALELVEDYRTPLVLRSDLESTVAALRRRIAELGAGQSAARVKRLTARIQELEAERREALLRSRSFMSNISDSKRERCTLMLHAYLIFHAKKEPQGSREVLSWLLLLEWARLGGQPDEVIS